MKTYNSHEYIKNKAINLLPSLRYDKSEDFFKWREVAKEKLTELLMLPNETCEDMFNIIAEKDFGEYKRIDFEFQSEPDYFIPCHLLIPKGAEKPLPVMICLQGHSTGMHFSLGRKKFESDTDEGVIPRSFALQAVNHGMCAITMDQRYMGAAGQEADGRPACLFGYPALSALLLGRTDIGERVFDVMLNLILCRIK